MPLPFDPFWDDISMAELVITPPAGPHVTALFSDRDRQWMTEGWPVRRVARCDGALTQNERGLLQIVERSRALVRSGSCVGNCFESR